MSSTRRLSGLLFGISTVTVLGTYVGFPLLALVRGRLRPRPVLAADITPTVSVVIAAHNEEGGLGAKLESVLACDYPSDLLDVVVASDGSTDGTVQVGRSFADRGVRTLDLPRTGKADALNVAVATCDAEVLVFSDANNPLHPEALRALVRPLADSTVGGVAGDQRYLPDPGASTSAAGERSYWSFDRMLKSWESSAGSVVSATGALYAVRRDLCPMVVAGVTDDFFVSTNVIRRGKRLVLADDAVVYELPAAKAGLEFERKVRVMTRGLNGVFERRDLLDARVFGFYSVQLLLHKVLRRLMVAPLAVMWVTSLGLAVRGSRTWRLLALGQTAAYLTGAAGLVVRLPGRLGRPLALATYFVMINAASARAAWNVVRGNRITTWEPARPEGQ